MKDQPFKKYFPVDKAKSRESYRYPTYQHYYESKVSRLNVKVSPKKQLPFHSEKKLSDPENTNEVHTPGLAKTASKVNLKNQLEILKLQVQRIMEKKQGILKSPVEKKLFLSPQKLNVQTIVDSPRKSESDDNLSVNSQKILNQPLKKLELHRSTENYDHQQYLQLQNNLLKTQLRNLKNKYVNKKKELHQKCEVLEKKVVFLENSLFKSQQSLEAEIFSLKENLRILQSEAAGELIPTSDKIRSLPELSPKKDINGSQQSELLKQKLKHLYDQIGAKNKAIYQKDLKIEDLQSQISKIKKQSSFSTEKSKSVIRELDQIKKIYNNTAQRLNQKQMKIQELQQELQKERLKKFNQNNSSLNLFEERLQNLKTQYQSKLRLINAELEQKIVQNRRLNEETMMTQQELNFLKAQFKEQERKIQVLTSKLKQQKTNAEEIQDKYLKMLERTQRKHEEILSNIHKQYQSKVSVLSKKDSKSIKQQSHQKANYEKKVSFEATPAQEKEVRKWKIEYKQLKEKYEHHLKTETNKKYQFKEYYKNYREYKQKVEVTTHKLKLFQKEFQKYLTILTEKENELLQKEIQLRKLKNDHQLQKTIYINQNETLTQKCKTLQEKLNQESQKYQSQQKYRKEIEEKVLLTFGVTDESLKEVIERMKKRLIQQDEKFGKMIKQSKNKQSLNTKLKQELRDVMENMEKKLLQQKTDQIKDISDLYLKKQFESFKEWKSRSSQQRKIIEESNKALILEIQQLKNTIIQREESINFSQKELNTIIHSYNLKNIELNEMVQEKERMLQSFYAQIQEMNQIRAGVQRIFQEEIMMKNEEITALRTELATHKIGSFENKYFNTTFDDILKSNMQENKKLRQEITKKTEQIFRLRDNFSALRSQYQHLKAEIQINKLKMMSEKKNIEVNFQIETQNLKNELDMSEKKAISFQQKIKLLIEENKKKDGFIQTYIVGKKLAQNQKDLVTNFIKQYEITIGSSDIVNRLAAQTQEIQKLNLYNHNLLKEMSNLREKLLAYEAIDEEKVSVFDSKLSKYSIHSSEIKEELREDVDLFEIPAKKQKGSQAKLRKTESLQQFVAIEHEF